MRGQKMTDRRMTDAQIRCRVKYFRFKEYFFLELRFPLEDHEFPHT